MNRSTRRGVRMICSVAILCAGLLAGVHAADTDTYTQTRYPVVLVHGMMGFDAIGSLDYFYDVPAALRSGGATVYVSQESAFNSSEVRGEQLLAELRRLRAIHGHAKFNLIAHSHGGQTARYVAGVDPGLVASVTTMATPHQGSPTADFVDSTLTSSDSRQFLSLIVNAFGAVISSWSGSASLPQDSLKGLLSLTTKGAADFNARFPLGLPTSACGQGPAEARGIRFYSASGSKPVTNVFDPTDWFLYLTSLPHRDTNDGLVGRCSSHLGTVLRDDYPWNHFDAVNQSFGLRGFFTPDPVAFYRAQANRLKAAGL